MNSMFDKLKGYGLALVAGTIFSTAPQAALAAKQTAIVAGGCFWCVEADFESLAGVGDVVSGYTGGTSENPTYKEVSRGGTGHYEAVMIPFDDSVISYRQILDIFFRSVDPTDAGGQFCDRGPMYRTAIFALTQEQADTAAKAKAAAQSAISGKVVTPILPAATFYKAEDYHQDYYKGSKVILSRGGPKKQSEAYKFYRQGCGRDGRIQMIWGSDAPFVGN